MKPDIILRRWQDINKNRAHMEELILKLMENPRSEPEHLAQAHAMYSDVCRMLAEASHTVTTVIRTGSMPKDPMFPKLHTTKCLCGATYTELDDGKWHRCPSCGML